MADREKAIKGLKNLRDAIAFDYIRETDQAVGTIDDALELLKEQDDLGKELETAVELIHKKNERIKKLEEQIETLTRWRANAGAFD